MKRAKGYRITSFLVTVKHVDYYDKPILRKDIAECIRDFGGVSELIINRVATPKKKGGKA